MNSGFEHLQNVFQTPEKQVAKEGSCMRPNLSCQLGSSVYAAVKGFSSQHDTVKLFLPFHGFLVFALHDCPITGCIKPEAFILLDRGNHWL